MNTQNRLAGEKSPYLLQHAENPVNWFPWCEEAFSQARERDVPIFLSIGYSTCHWCHRLARESFEDIEVAELLNKWFVAIKVDREERPDIDAVYMEVCQTLTGSGGWPLTILMTPQQEPFFAGTYFPKRGSHGQTGLMELLPFIHKTWEEDRSKLAAEGRKITAFIKEHLGRETGGPVKGETLIRKAQEHYWKTFDSKWGGFGPMPKFPSPHNLLFLMETGEEGCLKMAEKTLMQMYRGGLFDHIGGGFCRYSTDERWLAPHFEKMLYDNALLTLAYAEGYRKTGKKLYRDIVRRVAGYVKRELTSEAGAFFCGQDADSEGVEGKYYLFSPGEIIEVLGEKEGELFCHRFDITLGGNFQGKSIPNRIGDPDYQMQPDDAELEKLWAYRKRRMVLHKDDKILTSWNGLMIAALGRASWILERPEYLELAQRAADFLWDHLQQEGYLKARWREEEAAYPGTLEDYAFFAWGLLECHQADSPKDCLKRAALVGERMLEQFFDEDKGGFYLYGKDSEQLVLRPKEIYDGATPSGNSVAALVLDRLALYTGEKCWVSAAEKQMDFMKASAAGHPAGHSFFLWQLLKRERETVCCTGDGNCRILEN